MNIVIANDHAAMTGGAAAVAIASAVGFAARGHRVIYFAATGPVAPELADSPVEIVCLDQPDITTAPSPLAFTRIATWNGLARDRLSELLGALDPGDTVVHIHSWAKVLSPSIGAALKRQRAAVVATLHDFFWVCPNGGFFVYPRNEICHRAPQSFDCVSTNCDQRSYPRKLWRSGRHWLLDHVSGLKAICRHAITLSATQERVAKPWLPQTMTLHRVDNPIDVSDRGPPKGESASGPFLFVGRLAPEKGARLFCEAARRIGSAARIVGDGPSRAELERDFPEFVFTGWKAADEVAAEMRAARALVFPSVLYEGQPLTVYEALANGCPVIASDAGAAVEAVAPEETGLIFRSGDIASLAEAMTAVTEIYARAMGLAAYERYWRAPLTLDKHLDGVMAVYRAAMMADAGIAA